MTDAGLMGKAIIDWDHLDATDSTGQLGSLINLARPTTRHSAGPAAAGAAAPFLKSALLPWSRTARRTVWHTDGAL